MTGSMLNVEPSIANAVPVESITEKHWQSVTYQYSSRRVTINAADLLRAIGKWCPEPDNGERMYCGPSDVIPLMIRCGILAARHRCQPPVPPAMHRPPQPLHASPFSYTHPRLPPHRGDILSRYASLCHLPPQALLGLGIEFQHHFLNIRIGHNIPPPPAAHQRPVANGSIPPRAIFIQYQTRQKSRRKKSEPKLAFCVAA